MKKILIGIGVVILSFLITLVTFELMSWYHFGDIPTQIVLIRLIIFFSITTMFLIGIILLINKFKK